MSLHIYATTPLDRYSDNGTRSWAELKRHGIQKF
jgi:hypothetical protein